MFQIRDVPSFSIMFHVAHIFDHIWMLNGNLELNQPKISALIKSILPQNKKIVEISIISAALRRPHTVWWFKNLVEVPGLIEHAEDNQIKFPRSPGNPQKTGLCRTKLRGQKCFESQITSSTHHSLSADILLLTKLGEHCVRLEKSKQCTAHRL